MQNFLASHHSPLTEYECQAVLHHNHVATTYRAKHKTENQVYIIKVLNDRYLKPDETMYFAHEYETSQLVHHTPGVVKPIKIENTQHGMLIVYENFEAKLLSHLIAEQTLSLSESLQLSLRLVQALNQVHQSDVIHKDITPNSILYDTSSKKLVLLTSVFQHNKPNKK